ncbi:hypothetical protein NOS3756_60000 (plasmid) [Nostoc sp. NIES-3756]|uniref:hypothetical protein n=1 Tax=Nostoc sp. NIES-3756 TaxID=1751286 RepID=UPI00071F75EE|nr:hypothetical protein [Nostoc sp. NIES-3756]BAT56988.1 hypothetical protein NOS3756_60000 [Nostoc sp. NIES-3756]
MFIKMISVFSVVTIGILSTQFPSHAEVQTSIGRARSNCPAISHDKNQETVDSIINSPFAKKLQSNVNKPGDNTQEIRFPIKKIWWCVKCESGVRRSVKAYTEVDAGLAVCGVQNLTVRRGKCPEL